MKKYNTIFHMTTYCNYNCSYCDVIKDGKTLTSGEIDKYTNFILRNILSINSIKFFGGEPLLAFGNIKNIINTTSDKIGKKYEIVTNTSLITDEIGEYFEHYFSYVFFSIDTENKFSYENVTTFVERYKLRDKLYINLIISPGTENDSFLQFIKLYQLGFKKFNILPVYYTKTWSKNQLLRLSNVLRDIIHYSIIDNEIILYGFQNNAGLNNSLLNRSLFIDIGGAVYYSDFPSMKLGAKIKKQLYLGDVGTYDLRENIDEENMIHFLIDYEQRLAGCVSGQLQLHKIMDYFSKYLNYKDGL